MINKTGFNLMLALLCLPFILHTQNTQNQVSDLERAETEVQEWIRKISDSPDIVERLEFNKNLLSSLEETMTVPGAMKYPFDKFNSISDLSNSNKDFRIFTWELENENGNNTYFGLACYLSGSEVNTEVLIDSSENMSNAEFLKLPAQKWYGALYYGLREIVYKKEKYFILLGINRNDILLKKRIIEIVETGENLHFGKEVFDFRGQVGIKRKIYKHSGEAEMSIWFDDEEKAIIMDHLSPLSPVYEGKFEYYAPDLSFDALLFKKGKLEYKEDFDARMDKNLKDRFYDMELPKQEKIY